MERKRHAEKILIAAVFLAPALALAYLYSPWPIEPNASLRVFAHRGIHQTFPLAHLKNDTCTGKLIRKPEHAFIENTLPSMRSSGAVPAVR